MSLLAKILIASFLSGVLSLFAGILLLGRPGWVRKFSIHFISFAVGALLAAAFLDLFPEALEFAENTGLETNRIFVAALSGILAFFLLEKLIFKYHPHHHGEEGQEKIEAEHHHATPTLLLIGDTIHNFIDGVVIAVTFLAEPALGILTAVAVAAHEIPQEIGDFSVMLHHNWSRRKVLWSNVVSAIASLVGATLAYLLRDTFEPYLPQLLAFTAGVFIYIASSDLIPDLSHESGKDKLSHIAILVFLGILTVWLLGTYLGG